MANLREWFEWFSGKGGRRIGVTLIRVKFGGPDNARDRCIKCSVERRHHDYTGVGHNFEEAHHGR